MLFGTLQPHHAYRCMCQRKHHPPARKPVNAKHTPRLFTHILSTQQQQQQNLEEAEGQLGELMDEHGALQDAHGALLVCVYVYAYVLLCVHSASLGE